MVYEKSHSQINEDILHIENEAKKRRNSIRNNPTDKIREIEKEMIEQLCTQREMDQTSKYANNQNNPKQQLEKTTPRSARPIESEKKRPVLPKLPLYNLGQPRVTPQSRAVNCNFSLFNQSSIEKNDSAINESEIVPPPCLLNDQFGEWDSMLDDTKIQIDPD